MENVRNLHLVNVIHRNYYKKNYKTSDLNRSLFENITSEWPVKEEHPENESFWPSLKSKPVEDLIKLVDRISRTPSATNKLDMSANLNKSRSLSVQFHQFSKQEDWVLFLQNVFWSVYSKPEARARESFTHDTKKVI